MVPVDRRMLFGGIAMIAAGIALSLYLNSIVPVGTPGMTEEAAARLILEQRENEDYDTLSGILMGIGFLLVLVSFGARRRRGSIQKKEEKPAR